MKDNFSPQSRTCFASKVLQKCLLFVADKCTEKNRSVSESESCFISQSFIDNYDILQLLKSRLDMIAADWFDRQF